MSSVTRSIKFYIVCALLLAPCAGAFGQSSPSENHPTVSLSKIPPCYLENRGQWDTRGKYLLRSGNLNLWITDSGVIYDLFAIHRSLSLEDRMILSPRDVMQRDTVSGQGHAVAMNFLNALSPNAVATSSESGTTNYFIGNDSTKWVRGARSYADIGIEHLYEGIEARFYVDNGDPRYDLILEPGADANTIAMKFSGQDALVENESGALTIKTSMGDIELSGLYAYQSIGGKQKQIQCEFVVNEDDVVTFNVGAYDQTQPLIIDPLIYSTYLGASGMNQVNAMAVDAYGQAFVAGVGVAWQSVPVKVGAYTKFGAAGIGDATVTKLNAAGTAVIYTTFVGGHYLDIANGIALDSEGNAYITGTTAVNGNAVDDFPTTTGVVQPQNNCLVLDGTNAFVAKLDSTGTKLLYSTCLGGQNNDGGNGITVDKFGDAFITGYAYSSGIYPSGYPTTAGAFQDTNRGVDITTNAIVTKLNPTATALLYSTYLGGAGASQGYGIVVDSVGEAFVTGVMSGTGYGLLGFPTTTGAFERIGQSPSSNVFVTKLNPRGNALIYSTILGGWESADQGRAIAIDGNGDAFITGFSDVRAVYPAGYPTTPGAFQPLNNSRNAIVTKLNPTGSGLFFSTYLGGSGDDDRGMGITLDRNGDACVVGWTNSMGVYPLGFPTTANAFQDTNASPQGWDAFLTVFNQDGTDLLYSTYFGGRTEDYGTAIAIDASGVLYFGGYSTPAGVGDGFPITSGAFQTKPSGLATEPFAAKFGIAPSYTTFRVDTVLATICDSAEELITLANHTGVTLTLDSIHTFSPFFSRVGALPIQIADNDSITIPVEVIPLSSGTIFDSVILFYTSSDGTHHRKELIISAQSSVNTAVLAIPDSIMTFNPTSTCLVTSLPIYFSCTGCGKLQVSSEKLSGLAAFTLQDNHASSLASSQEDSLHITFHPNAIGLLRDTLTINSNTGSRRIYLTGRGLPDTGAALLSTTSLNFGTLKQGCHSGTASFSFTNATCGSITLDSIGGLYAYAGALQAIPSKLPSQLQIDSSFAMNFGFFSNTPGKVQGSVLVYYHTSDGLAHDTALTVSAKVLPATELGVALAAAGYSSPDGGSLDVGINLAASLDSLASANLGLQTIEIKLTWNTDLLTPISVSPVAPGVTTSSLVISGNVMSFTVTIPAGFTSADTSNLAVIHCKAFLTDTMQTGIAFSSAQVATGGPNPCFLQNPPNSSEFTLTNSCGDSTISTYLDGKLALLLTSIHPNPAASSVTLGITAASDDEVMVTLFDELGRAVKSQQFAVSSSGSTYRLDLSGIPAGSYIIRVASPGGSVVSGRLKIDK